MSESDETKIAVLTERVAAVLVRIDRLESYNRFLVISVLSTVIGAVLQLVIGL